VKRRHVYFWWSASTVMGATFIRWQRRLHPKDYLGKRLKGWWGVGAVVQSKSWDYPEAWRSARRNRLKRYQMWLAPHTNIFRTHRSADLGERPIKRPTMKQYNRLLRRRKK